MVWARVVMRLSPFVSGRGLLGRGSAGEGQEDLVERRLAQRDVLDLDAGRVERPQGGEQPAARTVAGGCDAPGRLVDAGAAAAERGGDRRELVAAERPHLDHRAADTAL